MKKGSRYGLIYIKRRIDEKKKDLLTLLAKESTKYLLILIDHYAMEDRFLVNGKHPPFNSIYVLMPERYLGELEDLIEYYNSTL
jgi:hypothetical protein